MLVRAGYLSAISIRCRAWGYFFEPESSLIISIEKNIITIEATIIIVPIAFISGVIPRRTTDHIYIGSVLSRPVRKKVTGISSKDRVKHINPDPINAVRILGNVI